MIDVKSVMTGVVKALSESFPKIPVYTEKTETGLKPPCFSAVCDAPEVKRLVGRRFSKRYLFSLYYFPGTDEPAAEIGAVEEKLFSALETIDADGEPVRAADMTVKTADGVMVMSVTYAVFALIEESAERMGDLVYKPGI